MHVERPLRQSSFLPPFSARLPLRQQFLGRALRVGTDFCWLHRSETKPRRRGRRGCRRRGSGATAAMPRRGWGWRPSGVPGPACRSGVVSPRREASGRAPRHVRGPRAATWRGQGQGATVKSPDAWIERVFPQSCFRLFLIKEETWFRAEPPFRALAVFQIFFSEPPELLDHSL